MQPLWSPARDGLQVQTVPYIHFKNKIVSYHYQKKKKKAFI